MRISGVILAGLGVAFVLQAVGQVLPHPAVVKMRSVEPKKPIICYAGEKISTIRVPKRSGTVNQGARSNSLVFDVTFIGFEGNDLAKDAFNFAMDIWSDILTSQVPIRVHAYWTPLETGVLGAAIWGNAFVNFPGAQKLNVFYPVALAEKIAGKDLNDTTKADLIVWFNSSYTSWHYNFNAPPPSTKYDLATVVLHEIAHGLGFVDSFEWNSGSGDVGVQNTGVPIVYDYFLKSGDNRRLLTDLLIPSDNLGAQLTSENLFFESLLQEGGGSPKPFLYAPSVYSGGSSISHLDESYEGEDALMTPLISPGEFIHDPGQISTDMLGDLGWQQTRIIHDPLLSTEDVNAIFEVIAELSSDQNVPFDPSTLKVHYSTNHFETDSQEGQMTPTGDPGKYSFFLPTTGSAVEYSYYIEVMDNKDRSFVSPGKLVIPGGAANPQIGKGESQVYYTFKAGPDTQAPELEHTPIEFVYSISSSMQLTASASDDLGIQSVVVEYAINNVFQSPVTMPPVVGSTDIYQAQVPLPALAESDILIYRIVATDVAIAGNKSYRPGPSEYYTVEVIEIGAATDSYINDFEAPSDDFFGSGFTISTPTGFANSAIHSQHPYPDGPENQGFENYAVYQLKFPIRISAANPTFRFDEIVLIEPGEPGTEFGDPQFWDYVVAEASKDFGVTWKPLADGYDSRDRPEWLARWNQSKDGTGNSTALGDSSLLRTRSISLTKSGNFQAGDEVMIRFVLYSDQLVHGWGWVIDNVKIQIDDTPPIVLHSHYDYLKPSNDSVSISAIVSDISGLDKVYTDFMIDAGPLNTVEMVLVEGSSNQYTFSATQGDLGLSIGKTLSYRIRAIDTKENSALLPTSGFFNAPVYVFSTSPVDEYVTDFNTTNSDFIGNFYYVGSVAGFSSGILHTNNPYPVGFGPDRTSDLILYLKAPIKVNPNNPYVFFEEVVIVEGHASGVPYGDPQFKDYVIVEGSKDSGSTWLPLLEGYDSESNVDWKASFITGAAGKDDFFETRQFKLTDNGNFAAGDNVLLRFRLFSNGSINGWGWAIDNLSIQGPITGIEESPAAREFLVYPNPVSGTQTVRLSVACQPAQVLGVRLVSAQGKIIDSFSDVAADARYEKDLPTSHLPAGLYIVSVNLGGRTLSKKFLKKE